MKREIKFRSWTGSEMVGPATVINENGLFVNHPNNIWCEGAVFQQWTGLKDINEKEIYEGDIVEWDRNKVGEVIWERARWNVTNIDASGECYLSDYFVTVIGNIFENPELLK